MSSKQKFWCACGTIQFYFEELNFLSHTDESFKDKTRVCGYKIMIHKMNPLQDFFERTLTLYCV